MHPGEMRIPAEDLVEHRLEFFGERERVVSGGVAGEMCSKRQGGGTYLDLGDEGAAVLRALRGVAVLVVIVGAEAIFIDALPGRGVIAVHGVGLERKDILTAVARHGSS